MSTVVVSGRDDDDDEEEEEEAAAAGADCACACALVEVFCAASNSARRSAPRIRLRIFFSNL